MTDQLSGSRTASIKVLLVDDSAIVRGMLRNIIEREHGIDVVGSAANGRIGVEDYKRLKPDVVVMDLEMPEMDGIEALKEILKNDPQAKVIICSSLTQVGASASINALNLGAVSCLAKPSSAAIDRSQSFEEQLTLQIKAFKKKKLPHTNTSIQQEVKKSFSKLAVRHYPSSLALALPKVLAIGSSTGGPKALTTLLSGLNTKVDIPPVLITQHMPAGFTKMLAVSIEKACGLPTFEATNDMLVKPKTIYIAPGGKHLKVERRTSGIFTVLSDEPPVNYCKPAVDIMMESILQTYQSGILSVILTGMGSDGLKSCQKIVEASANNVLIAQDEATSVVWGMPAAVANAGLCHDILPLDKIASAINNLFVGRKP